MESHRKHAIPWSVLSSSSQPSQEQNHGGFLHSRKSFADVVHNQKSSAIINHASLPTPCLKGNRLCVKILQEDYVQGLDNCKLRLHGRVMFPKGTITIKLGELRNKIQTLWKLKSQWCIISLGRGFFEFSFQSEDDLHFVRSNCFWNLHPGSLRLFTWSKDFCPASFKQSTTQVWIRIYHLPQEYWIPNVINAIAASIGQPICLDSFTKQGCDSRLQQMAFGHFARVLVDLDMSKELWYQVWVERDSYDFMVQLEYENLPEFCDNCFVIGHSISNCRFLQEVNQGANDISYSKKNRMVYVPKKSIVSQPTGFANTATTSLNQDVVGQDIAPVFVPASCSLKDKNSMDDSIATKEVGAGSVIGHSGVDQNGRDQNDTSGNGRDQNDNSGNDRDQIDTSGNGRDQNDTSGNGRDQNVNHDVAGAVSMCRDQIDLVRINKLSDEIGEALRDAARNMSTTLHESEFFGNLFDNPAKSDAIASCTPPVCSKAQSSSSKAQSSTVRTPSMSGPCLKSGVQVRSFLKEKHSFSNEVPKDLFVKGRGPVYLQTPLPIGCDPCDANGLVIEKFPTSMGWQDLHDELDLEEKGYDQLGLGTLDTSCGVSMDTLLNSSNGTSSVASTEVSSSSIASTLGSRNSKGYNLRKPKPFSMGRG